MAAAVHPAACTASVEALTCAAAWSLKRSTLSSFLSVLTFFTKCMVGKKPHFFSHDALILFCIFFYLFGFCFL